MITASTSTDTRGITCCVVLRDEWTLLVLVITRSVSPWECRSGDLRVDLAPNTSDAQRGALIHAHQARCERGPG